MSKRIQGILIVLCVIITLGIIAYYAAGGTLTIRNVLEDGLDKQNSIEKSVTSTATSTEEEVAGNEFQETNENYEIHANYPRSGVGYKKVREYVTGEIESFKGDVAESGSGTTLSRKHLFNSLVETYETEKYISYKITSYIYSGGANGIELVKTFVFTKDGHPVTLDELVSKEKRDELVREVKKGIRETNGLSANEEFQIDLFYEDFDNYFVTDRSLVLSFDEYAVAPGAAGVVSIPVDRSFLE